MSGARRSSPSASSQPPSISGGSSRMASAKARKICRSCSALSCFSLAMLAPPLCPGMAPDGGSLSEQRQLIARLRRRMEAGGVEHLGAAWLEAKPAAGAIEAGAQHVGVGAGADHPLRPGGIVDLAAMALRHKRQHMRRLFGHVFLEPFAEQRLQFERQAQERIAGEAG